MAYTPETMRKIERAAASDKLVSMNVVDAMKHFKLSHAAITEARRQAVTKCPRKALARALDEKHRTRMFNKLLRVEARYPFIHERLVHSTNVAAVCERYNITRQRGHQMLQQFNNYAHSNEMTANQLLDELKESA